MNDLYHDYLVCWEELMFFLVWAVCCCARGILAIGWFCLKGRVRAGLVVFWGWEREEGAWENVIHI
jgi:hypothetical protein